MAKNTQYHLHLKGYVGGYDFDADYVDYILAKNSGKEVHVLIDSLGGQSNTALSIFSAFRRHGNVNAHFVGMNASAATIASLGAKRITMDTSAMYLVHKCSVAFFEWGHLNADDLQTLITNIEHQKKDLDKLDANIAQMYATRCKKESAELLALMKEGGWLTAQEALAWGFVDELTDYEDESAPILNDNTVQALADAGIPIPNLPRATDGAARAKPNPFEFCRVATEEDEVNAEQSAFARFFNSLASFFKSNPKPSTLNTQPSTINNQPTMEKILKNVCAILALEALESDEGNITLTDAQAESLESSITADKQTIDTLNAQITSLNAEIAELKKKPAETSSHVVEDKHEKSTGEKSAVDRYFESRANAKSLYDLIP